MTAHLDGGLGQPGDAHKQRFPRAEPRAEQRESRHEQAHRDRCCQEPQPTTDLARLDGGEVDGLPARRVRAARSAMRVVVDGPACAGREDGLSAVLGAVLGAGHGRMLAGQDAGGVQRVAYKGPTRGGRGGGSRGNGAHRA